MGNTISSGQTLLAKDATACAPANAQGDRFHVVEFGDSLAIIALQLYGNTNDLPHIYKANRNEISRADVVLVGRSLRIPNARTYPSVIIASAGAFSRTLALLAQRLAQIIHQITHILDPHRQPQEPFGNAGMRLDGVAVLDQALDAAQ